MLMSFKTCMTLHKKVIKQNILKNVGNQTVLVPAHLLWMVGHTLYIYYSCLCIALCDYVLYSSIAYLSLKTRFTKCYHWDDNNTKYFCNSDIIQCFGIQNTLKHSNSLFSLWCYQLLCGTDKVPCVLFSFVLMWPEESTNISTQSPGIIYSGKNITD